jgi:hypothetical protein
VNKPSPATDALEVFRGTYSNADQQDIPPGHFFRMVNMMVIKQGELTTRGGLREVTLEVLE